MRLISTERLKIRDWQETDLPVFHRLNSDPKIMQFFPSRYSLEQSEEKFKAHYQSFENSGFGYAALEARETGKVIGMCGLLKTDLPPQLPYNTTEIGWRLLPEYWGFGLASEAAKALMAYGFETLKLREIISFTSKSNEASIAVMENIGMKRCTDLDFDHPNVPESHPELIPHIVYSKKQE